MLPKDIANTVSHALSEDIGKGDLTATLVPNQAIHADVIMRESGILCGCAWFEECFRQLDTTIRVDWHYEDGALVPPQSTVCTCSGPVRPLLSGERTALNFLQLLSGVASLTHKYVEAITGTPAKLLDTRKTIPGLRAAEKYAVTCGGGHNHRQGLFDAVLIKENHILAAGSVRSALQTAKENTPTDILIEIEVENLDQLQEAIDAGASRILLDNFSVEGIQSALSLAQGHAELEASGSINLDNIRTIAQTGIDYISVGALTKHILAVDFSMRFHTIST